jgi:1-acyl-sn-glycerol-3-phosphate acyltransferase
MVVVFPEGHKGTGKRYRERYKLQRFNVGFMELSLIHKTPIVPTAVIGAEEQYPFMVDLKPVARALNFPYFPVTPLLLSLGPVGLLPLPTKYIIHYGEALHFYRDFPPETVKDPEKIHELVGTVKTHVQELLDRGLRERNGVFGFSLSPLKALLRGRDKTNTPEERRQIREKAGS